MKRSEMVSVIANELMLQSFYTEVLDEHRTNAAEILKLIEDIGMRPPVIGSFKSQIAAAHNEWEPENVS